MKLSTAKARAWKACSKYIRTKFSVDGMCECVTCGKWNPIAETDAGHFVPKKKGNSVYFVEENIHCQCAHCNRFDGEHSKIAYTRYMESMYGPEKVDELTQLAEQITRYRAKDYLEIEAKYKLMLLRL